MLAPDEMPTARPSRAETSRAVAKASSLETWTTSSRSERSQFFGTKPAPMPWILWGEGWTGWPLRVCVSGANDFLAELEIARQMEVQTFTDLLRGTRLSLEKLTGQLARADWYLMAPEAAQLELVAGLL